MATRKSRGASAPTEMLDPSIETTEEATQEIDDDLDLRTLAAAHRTSRPSLARGPRDRGRR